MMSRRPDAIAVTDGNLEFTYDELRRASDLIARSLLSHGVTRGSVVGMHLPRSADAIAVMLGVMAAGCVHLPLDPSYPADRLRYMLDQAEVVAVISNSSNPDLYGSHRMWLSAPGHLAAEPEMLPSELLTYCAEIESLRPEDHAYIVFTSGSTGQPKGVMVTHENITLMNEWSKKFLEITESDSSATSCSLSFDASFHEVLLPLSAGGTVHVIPHALELGQLTRKISLVATTPTVASELLRAGQLPPLRVLIVGGEVLTSDVAAYLLTSGLIGRLLNGYGPTECTVCVTVQEVRVPIPTVIPIGQPAPGTDILIVDENGEPLPDGERGEIWISGGQVSDGYVGDPAGTAERFVVGPDTRRYYRTGDLGHRSSDGSIYFGGRADRQVKINGIRIELGEVDAVLRSHPHVSDATTVIRGRSAAVAYVVPVRGADIDIVGLKSHLARQLPRFILPASIVVLAELPKTVNGKLDLSALPEWPRNCPERHSPFADDHDECTARVIQVVAEVTGFVGRIKPSDDFIDDLGGTSLGIMQVLAELERHSGRRMHLNEALADTSVAGLASILREGTAHPAADFAFNTDGDAPPLFLIHTYLGGMLNFRRVAELLPPSQPVYGLYVYEGTEQSSNNLTVSSMAQNAVNRIRKIQPTGQVALLGHSAGGVIAFEAARKIIEAGDPEPRVMLVDVSRPYGPFDYYWGEAIMQWRDLAQIPGRLLRKAVYRTLQTVMSTKYRPKVTVQTDDLMSLNERMTKSVVSALKAYRARSYNGRIAVMRTRQGRLMAFGRSTLGWASVTRGAPEIIDVPGTHLTVLEPPHILVATGEITSWLARWKP